MSWFGPSKDEVWRRLCQEKVRDLFANPKLRALIQAQPKIHLQVKDDEGSFYTHFPDGVDELCFQVLGVSKDVDQLKGVFDLFAEILHQLCRIGSAYKEDPKVAL